MHSMEIISSFFTAYAAVAALVAARLGWHMARRLDRFDWHHNKPEIWGFFFVFSLLWPIALVKPQILIKPDELFDELNYSIAMREREETRLWNNPPPCGPTIRYRQDFGRNGETFGEFTFQSADVETAVLARLRDHPHLAKDQEGAILNWLRRRDDAMATPAAVPEPWWRFQFIADHELRAGRGEVHCLKCNDQITHDELACRDDHGVPSWNFNRLYCPSGHPLLIVETVHFMRRLR